MPALDRVLKNFSLFVDGRGYAGRVSEVKLPQLEILEEDIRAGGLDSPIGVDMGQAKMESTFTLVGYEPEVLRFWGVAEGQEPTLEFRGALRSLDGTVESVRATMRGRIRIADPQTATAGQAAPVQFTLNPTYYRLIIGSTTVYEIDVVNHKRIVNGVDQLADIRGALGQ